MRKTDYSSFSRFKGSIPTKAYGLVFPKSSLEILVDEEKEKEKNEFNLSIKSQPFINSLKSFSKQVDKRDIYNENYILYLRNIETIDALSSTFVFPEEDQKNYREKYEHYSRYKTAVQMNTNLMTSYEIISEFPYTIYLVLISYILDDSFKDIMVNHSEISETYFNLLKPGDFGIVEKGPFNFSLIHHSEISNGDILALIYDSDFLFIKDFEKYSEIINDAVEYMKSFDGTFNEKYDNAISIFWSEIIKLEALGDLDKGNSLYLRKILRIIKKFTINCMINLKVPNEQFKYGILDQFESSSFLNNSMNRRFENASILHDFAKVILSDLDEKSEPIFFKNPDQISINDKTRTYVSITDDNITILSYDRKTTIQIKNLFFSKKLKKKVLENSSRNFDVLWFSVMFSRNLNHEEALFSYLLFKLYDKDFSKLIDLKQLFTR